MSAPLEIEDFVKTVKTLEALRHKDIRVTGSDGEQAIKAHQGFDKAVVDLETMTSVRIALSGPQLQASAVFNPSAMRDTFDNDDLDALRKNVIDEFGPEMWPKGQELDFVLMVRIMDACNKALDEKVNKIVSGPKQLRWEFEESSLDARIAAIQTCDLIGPYERLKATLIELADDSLISDALVQIKPISSVSEYMFADSETSLLEKTPLPEIPFSAEGAILN